MANLNSVKSSVFDGVQRAQHHRSSLMGMTAHERHTKFVTDYLRYYGGARADAAQQPADPLAKMVKTDFDALREEHRFIRTAEDDTRNSWEVRLAKRYYSRLFKEYCIADLSRHKESKLGLRWRTEKEVISGKGQFICGAKGCDKRDGLCSYEVNFAYTEAGQQRQALVKLRLCSGCAYKLNYRKEKQYRKAEAKRRRSRGDGSGDDSDEGGGGSGGGGGAARSARERAAQFLIDQLTAGASEYDPAKAVAPPPGKSEAALAQEGAEARRQRERQEQEQQATMPATEEVWEQKPVQEASAEEEFEQYFEGMFL